MKRFSLVVFALIALLIVGTVNAGGGPVEFNLEPFASPNVPDSYLNPGEQFTIHAKVYADGPFPTYCKGCYIKFALQNPQNSDYLSQSADKTDQDGKVDIKVISKISGIRTLIVQELRDNNDKLVSAGSYANLYYKSNTQPAPSLIASPYPTTPTPIPTTTSLPVPTIYPMPGAPQMVYPQNGQTLDLEGAYMFKVTLVSRASGYLFGLFQDGNMVYENYRDNRTLSSNGEFAVWESNPYHAKFHEGPVEVWVRALVNNQWTDARIITIHLKPRNGNNNNITQVTTTASSSQQPIAVQSNRPWPIAPVPVIESSQKIITVTDSSASVALKRRIDELQAKLEESQRRQSVLERQLNQIMSWIKSIFPFNKN